MRDKLFRSIAFAAVAAFTVGVVPSYAAVDVLSDGNSIVADGMFQKPMRRVYKRAAKKVARQAPATKTVTIVKERIIEKPVVIEKQVEAPAVAAEEPCVQPAVVESTTPVIIDRYEKRHRSLIHLGLFPINLLGE